MPIESVSRAEAEFAPGPAVDDGDRGDDVLDGDPPFAELTLVDEESLGRGVREQESEGAAFGDEVDPDLWSAAGSLRAVGTGSGAVTRERLDAVEGSAGGLAVLVERTRTAEAEDAGLDAPAQGRAGLR